MMRRISEYMVIKGLSFVRMLREIPFIYQLVLTAVVGLSAYALVQIQLNINLTHIIIALGIFILADVYVCSFSFSEKILLKTLKIKMFPVFLIKSLLLGIPFFLLDISVGLITLIVGTPCGYLLSGVSVREGKSHPVFYKKSAYQWLSAFRKEGLWFLIAGFLCFGIALFHGNKNMLCAAFACLMCVPCFISYYRMPDRRIWLVNYRNASFLIRSKLTELFINALLPALICLPLIAIWQPVYILFFAKLLLLFLFVDILCLYCYYLGYPSEVMSMLCSILIIVVWSVLMFMHPLLSLIISPLLLLLLHIVTIQNLKSILYVTPAS